MKLLAVYLLTLFFFLLSFQHAHADPIQKNFFEYFGADHNEAEFSIAGKVQMKQSAQPTLAQVDPMIRKQMRFMLGLMRSRSLFPAALYPKFSFTTTTVKQESAGVWMVGYTLKAKGVFPVNKTDYSFTVPYNPITLFADSQGKCMQGEEASEATFWYHWEPKMAGCPLVENVHYFNVTTQLKRLPNTVETYPEYAKLVDSDKTIKVTMFFGFSTYDYTNWNPDIANQTDWGIKGFNLQRQFLKEQGFAETVWNKAQVEKVYIAKDKFVPYVSEMVYSGGSAKIRIRMVLAETGLFHNSIAFHTFLKDSLAHESVVVYDGHSGLGKNLDMAQIEKLRSFKFVMNPNYQILFLGSCVPYSYYTDMFFARKKTPKDPNGTLNLDIFSYAKEAEFGNKEDHELMKALMKYAQQDEKTSFQTIIKNSPNFYFGINGDEDNPKSK